MRQDKAVGKRLLEKLIWDVWGKGQVIGANDPVLWRMDMFGAWIFRGHYEKKNSEYGWEIGFIKPLDKGGTSEISNLIPLHCGNTLRNPDGSPDCGVISESYHNVSTKIKQYQIVT